METPERPADIPARRRGAVVRVSSEWDSNHGAQRSELHMKPVRGVSGGWAAGENDTNQWMEFSFAVPQKFGAIETQGRHGCAQWVTEYMVQYSYDSVTWHAADEGKIFEGNSDSDTPKRYDFRDPFTAYAVRIKPTAWHGHLSMRAELYLLPSEV
eukprot:TRINITY_DN67006_c13_g2_i1.p1 TRINITY_DN67006_c13_g2~~TRINITY_DN67006_c13_g2_i1.p1  ORF type:complete len:155 (-),score=8.29 TRINITY_DN67006_c13_g2_i1:1114-1578(-)